MEFEKLQQGVVELYNLSGQLMSSQNIHNQASLTLDVSALSNGMYICIVRTKDKLRSKKISVMK